MKAINYLFAALGIAAAFSSCRNKADDSQMIKPETKPTVKIASVSVESVDQLQVYSAIVEGDVRNNIAPSSPSRIDRILVEVGDNVKRGQKLVQMDESNLHQLALQIQNQEVQFSRTDELYKVGGVSKAEWDNVKMSLEVNRTAYNNLLTNTQLVSPIDGVVTARNYDNGDLYSGQPVLVVQSISPVKLLINVSEQFFSRVSLNDPVTVELDAYPGEQFAGKISLIYPAVDAASHPFPVEIKVTNADRRIRPGMFARATLNIGTEQHVVVPDIAIVKRAGSGDRFVYVYENGRVSYTKVELGQRMGDRYELVSGISDNAEVVVAGQNKLVDGLEVDVQRVNDGSK